MGYAGGTLKRWDGSQWVGPAKLKTYDSSDWLHKPLYRWDGSQWLEVDTGRQAPADVTGVFTSSMTTNTIDHVQTGSTFTVSMTTNTIDHVQTGSTFTVQGTYGVA